MSQGTSVSSASMERPNIFRLRESYEALAVEHERVTGQLTAERTNTRSLTKQLERMRLRAERAESDFRHAEQAQHYEAVMLMRGHDRAWALRLGVDGDDPAANALRAERASELAAEVERRLEWENRSYMPGQLEPYVAEPDALGLIQAHGGDLAKVVADPEFRISFEPEYVRAEELSLINGDAEVPRPERSVFDARSVEATARVREEILGAQSLAVGQSEPRADAIESGALTQGDPHVRELFDEITALGRQDPVAALKLGIEGHDAASNAQRAERAVLLQTEFSRSGDITRENAGPTVVGPTELGLIAQHGGDLAKVVDDPQFLQSWYPDSVIHELAPGVWEETPHDDPVFSDFVRMAEDEIDEVRAKVRAELQPMDPAPAFGDPAAMSVAIRAEVGQTSVEASSPESHERAIAVDEVGDGARSFDELAARKAEAVDVAEQEYWSARIDRAGELDWVVEDSYKALSEYVEAVADTNEEYNWDNPHNYQERVDRLVAKAVDAEIAAQAARSPERPTAVTVDASRMEAAAGARLDLASSVSDGRVDKAWHKVHAASVKSSGWSGESLNGLGAQVAGPETLQTVEPVAVRGVSSQAGLAASRVRLGGPEKVMPADGVGSPLMDMGMDLTPSVGAAGPSLDFA